MAERGDEDAWAGAIARELRQRGFAVCDEAPVAALRPALCERAAGLERDGAFRPAGVGRGAGWRLRPEIRDDRARWIEPWCASRAERRYLAAMESLRLGLNRELLLGLFGFEAHFALFPPGARYRTHLDRFADASHRIVSVVFYLNQAWSEAQGGALRLYLEDPDAPPWQDVLPLGGRLVVFESARFHHEVRPAQDARRSIVGWFTRRA
jgi:SM-20-related protein